ncbi:CCA tRNA nucleotidyltransferase [Rhodobaculum claviforme]|uniref:CCA tRNA nucleotidyltransferase n=1 Tax=Rhodobaculum claviforme TaxID=1549854 RepID=A0A934TJN4_9RHOB|nr:CCA tRNA nucleotidyltransferase [Rhodobaculum claviforme]MBK5926268.1 CCA tRNA nucleotidyltransferase [Rhodobaculum claviforme]
MRLSGAWMADPGTQAVCAMLVVAGHEALFVGGCVRNGLLHQPVADVDLATDALPDRVMALAEGAGLQAVPTGIAHGTVTVVANGVGHEVTTFRRDVETFGRHAVVAFSGDVAEDAARRDFTINALYARPTGEVLDPLGGGLRDLAARRVRFVGTAHDRIREDYLRILRFFRFHAWYGDDATGPDPQGLAACAALADGVDSLSRERLGTEMRKLLAAPDPTGAVQAMERAGVLTRVLPGAQAHALPRLIAQEGDAPPRWQRRLAVLGGRDTAEALRLSRADSRQMAAITDDIGPDGPGPAELGHRHGAWLAADIVMARAALTATTPPPRWREEIGRGAAAEFPIRATDLMPDLQGAALGAALRSLHARWVASDFTLTRAALLDTLRGREGLDP